MGTATRSARSRARAYLHQHHVGLLALFIALGGTGAYAADQIGSTDIARNAVRGKHVKADALTGADINEATLDLSALPAGPAGPVGPAGTDGTVGPDGPQGPIGPPGLSTGAAGGDLEGNYPAPTLKAPEATTLIAPAPSSFPGNDCGNPAFTSLTTFCGPVSLSGQSASWANLLVAGYAPTGFYKDRQGRVHLQGVAFTSDTNGAGNPPDVPDVIFYLPDGYHPSEPHLFGVIGRSSAQPKGVISRVDVHVNGAVAISDESDPVDFENYLSLEGISFRAG